MSKKNKRVEFEKEAVEETASDLFASDDAIDMAEAEIDSAEKVVVAPQDTAPEGLVGSEARIWRKMHS